MRPSRSASFCVCLMIYRRLSLLGCASAAAILLASGAVPSHAESLTDAVVAALNHHPKVEAAMENREAFGAERAEERSGYFPQVSLRAGAGRGFANNSTSRGLTTSRGEAYSWYFEDSATLTQPLFDGFRTVNRVDAAEHRRLSANYNIADVREGLALSTTIAYLDVLRSRAAVFAIEKHEQKINDYMRRIDKMVAEGAADKSMAVQAKDIKAQLSNTLAEMQGQHSAALASYLEAVGHSADEKLTKPALKPDVMPASMDAAVTAAKESHPLLKAAVLDAAALENEIEANKEFYYPKVSGELSHTERDQIEELGGESLDQRAMLRVNWDFSVGGGQFAKVRKAKHRYAESVARRAEKERMVEKDISIAFSDLDTATKQLTVLRERVTLNEELFKNYEAQFEGARINLLQLLQADNALFNAKLSLTGGEYRLLAAQYAILASMGGLQNALNIGPADVDESK